MKAKVIQTEFSVWEVGKKIRVEDEGWHDSFEESMLREGFSEIKNYENYEKWFYFLDDSAPFVYHRSWLEFEE